MVTIFVLFILTLLFLILFVSKAIIMVRQAETVVIERLGKFDRILNPGIHFVTPFVDGIRQVVWSYVKSDAEGRRYHRFTHVLSRIDLRESVYDFPKQNVITKDNVTMEINALLYYQITDPRAAVYEASNLPE
ncbi:MAG: SPFH domain-containing protein, partial [Candidatus Dependentiae bacterium]|nr:SPFH domain-containing protein [Candidatus Dependentiae bacterium]